MTIEREVNKLKKELAILKSKGEIFREVHAAVKAGGSLDDMAEQDRALFYASVAYGFIEMPRFCKRVFRTLGKAIRKKLRGMTPEQQGAFLVNLFTDIARSARITKNNETETKE